LTSQVKARGVRRCNNAAADTTASAMPHPFDDAVALTREAEGRYVGQAPLPYWNMVGPFGGTTAAALLHAAMLERDGSLEPASLTVNYCAPLVHGAYTIVVRTARAGRSVHHLSLELLQDGAVAATASVVLAARRDTWAHQAVPMPAVPPPEQVPTTDARGPLPWLQRYDFRFVRGEMRPQAQPFDTPRSPHSTLWIADVPPRPLDHLSLAALCDVFFVRIFQVRGTLVPAGTVTMTVHFHASTAEIAEQGSAPLLGVADAHTFTRNFGDQIAQLWSRSGRLLATTTQLAWFKE
jgi:acyl-CoA thioesterase